ncbi:hypothetical protein D3C71_1661070 [compost metagenome]
MIGQQFTFSHQRLNGVVEAFKLRDVAHVGRFVAQLTINLRQRGRPERVVAFAKIDKQ